MSYICPMNEVGIRYPLWCNDGYIRNTLYSGMVEIKKYITYD